ncbi:MAG: Wzz/FepE/Etk N-terminal domain-containing protein [Gammaproteobacteria bacterium]
MDNSHSLESRTMDDEIDLLELWHVIRSGKWIIIAITAVFAVGSVIYALWLPDIYRTEVLLAPVEEEQGGGLGGSLGQLGGLASLAGINLDAASVGVSMKSRALAILQSRFFIQDFFVNHDLLVPFMGSIPGETSGTIEIDPELYDENEGQWVREPSPAGNVIPSGQEVYEAFSEILTVSEDELTGLVTIALEWYEPRLIKQWMDLLVQDLNSYMREQDTLEAERAIEYLNTRLQETSLVEMRSVFFNLIEQQTQQVMLADAREEYALETIDPAVVPETKSAPRRSIICILITLLGGMLSVLILLLSHYLGNGKQEATAE